MKNPMIRFWKKLAQDRKIFGVLFFCTFSCVTGVGIVVPLLPVYAQTLGASGLYIGLIFGAFSISRSLFLPYFGRLSDRKGRKPFIVAGLLCYALISIAFTAFDRVSALIIIRFIQGIASAMILPVTQAYVGDITPKGDEGLSMGLFNMSVFIGLSIGPLLGGMINDRFGLDASFLCMGGMALFGFVLSLFFLPPRESERSASSPAAPAAWGALIKNRTILSIFSFRFSYTACIGMIWGFLPVYAHSMFSLNSSLIGILVMLGVFSSGLIHIPMGILADRFNKTAMVILGGLIVVCAVYSFRWADNFWDLFWANVLFGLGGGIAMPALMALAVISGAETAAMGSVMGALTLAHSLGMMCGSLLAGIIMDLSNLRYAFTVGALIMLSGVVLFGQSMLRKRPVARAPMQELP